MNSLDRKQLRTSLGRYRQLHALEPDNIGHLEQLARISLALGKAKRAAEFLVSRADVLARRGEFVTALADCDSAVSLVARYKPALEMRAVIEQIQARHRAAALMRPPRDPSVAPQTPEPDAHDLSVPARPYDPPTMELGADDLLDAVMGLDDDPLDALDRELSDLEEFAGPVVDASALLAVYDVDAVDAVEPISIEVTLDPVPEPVVDASALLAVYEVDGVDVVPVATEAPRQLSPVHLPMPVLRPPEVDLDDAPTLSARDATGLGLDDRDTLNSLPPPAALMAHGEAEPPSDAPTNPVVRPRPVRASQVEGVVHLETAGPVAASATLPGSPLLKALPRATRADLLATGTQITYAAGDVLVEPLTPRSAVYVVLYGVLDLVDQRARPPRAVAHLEPGDLLGDLEIVHGGPWRFEVIAREASALLRVEDGIIDALRQRFSAFDALLRSAASRRHAGWLLGANPMFRVLGPNERDLMTVRMRPQTLPAQALLCRQGDPIDGIVMVASGELIVRRDGVSVARLGAGRLAGLGALGRGDGLSSADIAAGPQGAALYTLDRAALEHLCAFPAIRALIEAGGRQRA